MSALVAEWQSEGEIISQQPRKCHLADPTLKRSFFPWYLVTTFETYDRRSFAISRTSQVRKGVFPHVYHWNVEDGHMLRMMGRRKRCQLAGAVALDVPAMRIEGERCCRLRVRPCARPALSGKWPSSPG